MSDEPYIQFPLCGLAFGDSEFTRLDHIISYGFISAGFTLLEKIKDDEERKEKAQELAEHPDAPKDYREWNNDHVAAMLGAKTIGISPKSMEASLGRFNKLRQFVGEFHRKHGRDVEVRVPKNLVFEVRDKKGMRYREFAVLCAVMSSIGAKKYPVRITRDQIRCRMLGYKSTGVMEAELAKRLDGVEPLTPRQINYTLDALDERKFFARARANERQTFYSSRLTQDQLEQRLIAGKSYSAEFHERRKQRNAELMAKIKAAKPIKVNTPIIVDKTPESAPETGSNDVRSVSTTASTGVSTGVSTLIETLLIETPSIETHSIQTPMNTAVGVFLESHQQEAKSEAEEPAFKVPTEYDAMCFAPTVHTAATAVMGAEWFAKHGSAPKWLTRDWKKHCTTAVLQMIAADRRRQKVEKLHGN